MTMESLELPQDIIWDGDHTPTLSPTHFSDASVEQILIFEDCFATGMKKIIYSRYICMAIVTQIAIENDSMINVLILFKNRTHSKRRFY